LSEEVLASRVLILTLLAFSSFHVLISADIYKGSFYANPVVDVPTIDKALVERSEQPPLYDISHSFSLDYVAVMHDVLVNFVHSKFAFEGTRRMLLA